MTVTMLIEELQKIQKSHPHAQVRIHHMRGAVVMYAVAANLQNAVWLEDRTDFDVPSELEVQYERAAENMTDELEFFTEMVNRGFTLEDFKAALDEEKYEYAKNFMEEHGLI